MTAWKSVPPRREGIVESVELPGSRQQALVEKIEEMGESGIIVSVSLMLYGEATMDIGKDVAERMLMEARR